MEKKKRRRVQCFCNCCLGCVWLLLKFLMINKLLFCFFLSNLRISNWKVNTEKIAQSRIPDIDCGGKYVSIPIHDKVYCVVFVSLVYLKSNLYRFWNLHQTLPAGLTNHVKLNKLNALLASDFYLNQLCQYHSLWTNRGSVSLHFYNKVKNRDSKYFGDWIFLDYKGILCTICTEEEVDDNSSSNY